ncbi:hypothetical protein Tco_1024192 [Tanacetum coccineum]
MDRRPLITELRYKADSLCEEILIVCKKRRSLADELRSIRGIVVVGKAAEFVIDTLRKDNAQVARLREVESQMEFRALEKELFVQKLAGNIPYYSVEAEDVVCEFKDEQRDFALRVNRLIGDTSKACLNRMYFVQELQSVVGEAVPAKTVVFLEKMMEKQEGVESQLYDLEKKANKMAHETNTFLFKIMDEEPSHKRIFELDDGQRGQTFDRS